MSRFSSSIFAIAAFFSFGLVLAGDSVSPDFSGVWELNAEKSQLPDGRLVTIKIEKVGNKIKWTRSDRAKDGKENVSEFICEAGASECELTEEGHKAKVSIWFNGPELVVLKTDGIKEENSIEWTLKMSDDKKSITAGLERIDPPGTSEKLVFNKKGPQ
jgi:hypothetical protein